MKDPPPPYIFAALGCARSLRDYKSYKCRTAARERMSRREGGRGGQRGEGWGRQVSGFLLSGWRALLRVYTALLSVTHETVAEVLDVVRSP